MPWTAIARSFWGMAELLPSCSAPGSRSLLWHLNAGPPRRRPPRRPAGTFLGSLSHLDQCNCTVLGASLQHTSRAIGSPGLPAAYSQLVQPGSQCSADYDLLLGVRLGCDLSKLDNHVSWDSSDAGCPPALPHSDGVGGPSRRVNPGLDCSTAHRSCHALRATGKYSSFSEC